MRKILFIPKSWFIVVLISCYMMNACELKEKESDEIAFSLTDKKEILVFAAASLSDVLEELFTSFEDISNTEIKLCTASSGTLARQIEQGWVPDLYISANSNWVDYLIEKEIIAHSDTKELAQNELVLITSQSNDLKLNNINELPGLMREMGATYLALGDPAHVPAGSYAKSALESLGIYEEIEERMLPMKDVRSALMIVEMGEADLGIVYASDAQRSSKVKVLARVPYELHPPITYVAAICTKRAAVTDCLEYLVSEEAQTICKKYAFKVL